MRSASAIAFVVLLLCNGVCFAEAPWGMLRKNAEGTAACVWGEPGNIEIREWHYSRLSKRKYQAGIPVWGSPAICIIEGRPMAFIGGYDHMLHALDLGTKERRWFKVTNGPITSAPTVGMVEGLPVVYWSSSDRSVYAHFAHDGLRLWTRELVRPTNTMGVPLFSSPLLHGGLVYVAGFAFDKAMSRSEQRAWLYCLNGKSGVLRFKIEVSQGPVSSPVGREIDGRYLVYVAARKGLLRCFDVSGKRPYEKWKYQMPHEVIGSPALAKVGEMEMVYLGSKFGNIIALNARTGEVIWKMMAGNWVDNTVCIGDVNGRTVVFAGSHDYKIYAFDAGTGDIIWKKHLGGEVYAAPAFFHVDGRPALATACLDNHAYVLDAETGEIMMSFFTGTPLWDKISKGDVLWGSPAVLEAGEQTAVVLGSYGGSVYVLPFFGECALRAKVRSSSSLWIWLLVVLVLFVFVVVPIVVYWPERE